MSSKDRESAEPVGMQFMPLRDVRISAKDDMVNITLGIAFQRRPSPQRERERR